MTEEITVQRIDPSENEFPDGVWVPYGFGYVMKTTMTLDEVKEKYGLSFPMSEEKLLK